MADLIFGATLLITVNFVISSQGHSLILYEWNKHILNCQKKMAIQHTLIDVQ